MSERVNMLEQTDENLKAIVEALGDEQGATEAEPETETAEVPETEEQAPVKIKIGDDEFDPDEAKRLIDLGKIGREAEEKYNTKIDKIWPDYSKTKNDFKELQESRQTAQIETKVENGEDLSEEEQMLQAQKYLKDKLGVVTKDDFEDLYQQRRSAERVIDQGLQMEKEIDGSDGRPAFKLEAVLEHAKIFPSSDLMKVYKDLNEEALDVWKESQLGKLKKPAVPASPTASVGAKQPSPVSITKDNLAASLLEELN